MLSARPLCVPAALFAAAAAAPALAGGGASVTFYTDHGLFTQDATGFGKALKFVEDFEESTAAPQSKTPFPNALQNGVPRPTFEFGIAATNLIIQTNITDAPTPPSPNPSNSQSALWVNGAGFIGSNSIKIGTDEFLTGNFSSLDLIFTSGDKTAVGLDVSTFAGFDTGHAGFIVSAYDLADNVIGTFTLGPSAPEPNKTFVGVWSPVPIGRLNVWGIFSVPQPFAIDNIEMWTVPTPGGAATLLTLAALSATRRRRN